MFPVVDAHFHIYDPLTRPDQDRHFISEFEEVIQGVNIVAAVHVQVENVHSLYETVRADLEAGTNPRGMPNAIAFYSHLDQGAAVAEEHIQRQLQLSSRVRSIRQGLTYRSSWTPTANPQLARSPAFLAAFALLKKYNLSFEAWCYEYQIREVSALAGNFPNTKIILNHFGGPVGVDDTSAPAQFSRELKTIEPRKAEQIFEAWKIDMSELAQHQNVFAKISGLTMTFMLPIRDYLDNRRNDVEELADAFFPWVEHTVNEFGVNRCVWASNFPPDGYEGITYQQNFEAYKIVFDRMELTEEEQRRIFFDNAVEFYRMDEIKEKYGSVCKKTNPEVSEKTEDVSPAPVAAASGIRKCSVLLPEIQKEVQIPEDVSFADFRRTVQTISKVNVLKYYDDEGDLVTLSSDDELKEAFRMYFEQGARYLKVSAN